MRATLAAVALALVATPAAATPTFGVPDVRRHLTGTATVHVLANDRAVYRITVLASVVNAESTTPYSWVELHVARCAKGACGVPVRYFAALAATHYKADDPSSWSVTLAAFGKPFKAQWAAGGPEGDVDTQPAVVEGPAVDFSTPWKGTATVTVLGRTCSQKAADAARHTTFYPTGFAQPTGFVPIPPKAPPGQPSAAKACRTGP